MIHILYFFLAAVVLWLASGLVLGSVERLSKLFHVGRFTLSFIVLGLLTSLTEMAVGVSALIEQTPGVFVGNLIGGAFAIVTLVIPLFAILNRGLSLAEHLDGPRLWLFLVLLLTPSLVILDATVTRTEAGLLIIFYSLFVAFFHRREHLLEHLQHRTQNWRSFIRPLGVVLLGAVLIFLAGRVLVHQTIYFATALNVPPFLMSLLVLSIGTNLPELTLAIRAFLSKRVDMALGDYLGSAAANVLLLGIFSLIHGPFRLETTGFNFTFGLIVIGYVLYFVFGRSGRRIARSEGIALVGVFLAFLLIQASEILLISRST